MIEETIADFSEASRLSLAFCSEKKQQIKTIQEHILYTVLYRLAVYHLPFASWPSTTPPPVSKPTRFGDTPSARLLGTSSTPWPAGSGNIVLGPIGGWGGDSLGGDMKDIILYDMNNDDDLMTMNHMM